MSDQVEIVHRSCPIRYLLDGVDYCGASESPCEYCVERKFGAKERKTKVSRHNDMPCDEE